MESIDFLQHNVWTVEDGLPMNTIMAITQTHDGYLWMGTEAGLVRFDGVKFRVFTHEDTPVFSSNVIVSLLVDRGGTLWAAARMGGVIRYKNGTFDAIRGNPGFLNSDVLCMLESVDGSVWIGSSGSGAGLNRISKGKIKVVPLPEQLPFRTVSCLLEDRDGRVWVGTRDGGLARIKKNGGLFEPEFIGLAGMHVTTLFEDRQGSVWTGTAENGLFKFRGGKRLSFTSRDGLSTDHIRCLYEDRFGNLWIGTQGGGINILAAGNNRISVYRSQEEFTGSGVLCFYEDREGTLWVGTDGRGLNSLRETKITTYSTKNGLSYYNVYGVFQDSKGRIWAGTKGYGVNYFADGRFHTITTRDGLSSDSVVSIAEDPSGGLWFGTLGGGVNRLKNGRFRVFNNRHGLSYNFIRSVYVDPEGNVLVGTVNGGIHRFVNGRFELMADVKSRVNILFKDSRGALWAGTLGGGLCRLKGAETRIFDTRNGLSDNIVTCIHEDRDGSLWLGTLKGLDRFKGGKFEGLSKKDGLPDDVVYCILEDHKHDFWISSNRGIYRLRRQEIETFFEKRIGRVTPVVFGREAGMRSAECNGGNQPPGWKSRDGKLWFPTTRGVSVIDPQNIGMNKTPPLIVIEKIITGGISYPAHDTIRIPPGKNNLEIHYTALSFVAPEKIFFKYKMVGCDKKWIDAGTDRTAYYTDLPPGKYRFRVTACNSDGVWSDAGAGTALHLEQRFYRTLAFQIFILLAVLSLAGFLIFYLKNNIQRKYKHKPGARIAGPALDPEKTKEWIQKLFYLMEVEKIYKESDLTLKSLASKLLVSSRTLSQIINDRLNTTFYEFVNEYRVKQAQEILSDPDSKHPSILDISYEVGYNSKSAFNRAFKHFSQMTPSEFRRKFDK